MCVGFGISKPEHVKAICKAGADGVIVGSAIVKIIERLSSHQGKTNLEERRKPFDRNLKNKKLLIKKIESYVKLLKKATRW